MARRLQHTSMKTPGAVLAWVFLDLWFTFNANFTAGAHQFHKEYGGPRQTHTRIIQAITGHGFVGTYFSLTSPHPAPVAHQTFSSAFTYYLSALYEEHRHLLLAASQDLSPSAILRTHKGLTALAKFIDTSNAFGKS
ncbi:hypothetical protein BU17DRAFT_103617 [Hysterangium stoloniferum]|nr:hypothetical protein BU17DRAFT_103617 [Hysterangium stoloniferum]